MRSHAIYAALAALVIAIIGCARPAQAQGLVLDNLVVDNQAGSVMVRFGVDVEDLKHVGSYLENGATFDLICKATLNREKGVWGSTDLSQARFVSSIKFDPLSKEYTLTLPGREQPLKNPDLAKLVQQAWGRINLDLGPWKALERGHTYRIKLGIDMARTDVPGWLRWTLFFWPWEVVPSTSYRLDFTY